MNEETKTETVEEINDSDVSITTFDNPFDPFNDFENWYKYDCDYGYYTWSKVCRLANVKDNNSEQENDRAIEDAIDRLIEIDVLNIYKKVHPSDYNT